MEPEIKTKTDVIYSNNIAGQTIYTLPENELFIITLGINNRSNDSMKFYVYMADSNHTTEIQEFTIEGNTKKKVWDKVHIQAFKTETEIRLYADLPFLSEYNIEVAKP